MGSTSQKAGVISVLTERSGAVLAVVAGIGWEIFERGEGG
jgi:hypothetical protein